MLTVYVEGIGLLGPGLGGWRESRAILAGQSSYVFQDSVQPQLSLLPAAERRRVSFTAKLAMHVALEALEQSGLSGTDIATVFASSDGDTAILHRLCSALAEPEKAVSPTSFHNSVHNAPAGYWSIATGSRNGSNSISCYDATFSASLLETACRVTVEHCPVLLAAYDMSMPEPLNQGRSYSSFATALVLVPQPLNGKAMRLEIDLEYAAHAAESAVEDPMLERLRRANPAARALPLLAGLAAGQAEEIVLGYLERSQVRVRVDS